jgi:hypothetical protein
MESVLLASIGIAVVFAGAAYWLVSTRRARSSNPAAAPRPSLPARAKLGGRFSAVQIRPRTGACRAAQLLRGHPFLAKDAPALPLRECKAERCACTFSKLPDRRRDGRRLEHGGLSASLFLAMNRRTKRDRRRAAQASLQN